MIDQIQLQIPQSVDGSSINRLVGESPPLDTNSTYCNLLQCSHFANTSVLAKLDGEVVGFISGYRIPERPDTLFVWQVVVGAAARGRGLASRMLLELVRRDAPDGLEPLRYMETTITKDNDASWALFRKLAATLDAPLETSIAFDQDIHFKGEHATEHLLRIGSFTSNQK